MTRIMRVIAVVIVLSMIFPATGFSRSFKKWTEVLASTEPVNIYVEKIVNETNDKKVNADTVTKIAKDIFAQRRSPDFDVVDDKSQADIVFSGAVIEYVWMKEAPITDVYGAAPLILDLATRSKKNYARMQVEYKIDDAASGDLLLDGVTQVTLKKSGIPEDESYDMIYERLSKVHSMNIFKRHRKDAIGEFPE